MGDAARTAMWGAIAYFSMEKLNQLLMTFCDMGDEYVMRTMRITLKDHHDAFIALLIFLNAKITQTKTFCNRIQLVKYRIHGIQRELKLPNTTVRVATNVWVSPVLQHGTIEAFNIRAYDMDDCEAILVRANQQLKGLPGRFIQHEWDGEEWLPREVSAVEEAKLYPIQERLVDLMRQSPSGSVLLQGPPGKGKSTSVKTACMALGRPLYLMSHDMCDMIMVQAKSKMPENAVLFLDNWDHASMWGEESVEDSLSFPGLLTLLDSLGPNQWVCVAVNNTDLMAKRDPAIFAKHRIMHQLRFD